MSEQNELHFKHVLTEQFTQSIKAIAELTQSIHNLQTEVEDHSAHILQSKSELLVLKDKLATLTRLVQGEGLTDSITSAVVEIQTRLRVVEEWQRDSRQDQRERKGSNTTIIVIVVSAVATLLATIASTFIPMILKGQ